MKRNYRYGGHQLGYFNASCPAPAGATGTVFPLAKATFFFVKQRITADVIKSCGVKR